MRHPSMKRLFLQCHIIITSIALHNRVGQSRDRRALSNQVEKRRRSATRPNILESRALRQKIAALGDSDLPGESPATWAAGGGKPAAFHGHKRDTSEGDLRQPSPAIVLETLSPPRGGIRKMRPIHKIRCNEGALEQQRSGVIFRCPGGRGARADPGRRATSMQFAIVYSLIRNYGRDYCDNGT